jgi:excisionase family DNA binding protein
VDLDILIRDAVKGIKPMHLKETPMAPADPLPHLLSIDELAEHLGVTVRHVRRLVAERRVPYLKVGRLVRFDPAEITAWLNGRRVANSRPA